jgi:signal transduction histidine kinase
VLEANAAAAGILRHDRKRLIGKPFVATIALADRRRLRRALLRPTSDATTLEVHLLRDSEPWTLVLRPLPRLVPRTFTVSLTREKMSPPPPPRPLPRPEHFVLRFPFAVVALRRDLRIAFVNNRARALLGREALRTGAVFGEHLPGELRELARRLTYGAGHLPPTFVALDEDRVLRVSGLAPFADEPGVLFLEDASEQQRRDRVMHEFLRNAAHQLRTPLAGITAAVEALQTGAKERPEDRDRFLGHIETHAARLGRIARGLLVLARAQTGEHLRVEFLELRALLSEVASSVDPADGVAIRIDCPPGLAALATRDLLQETLAALLENAVDQTYEGEIVLAAREAAGTVTVSVRDTGHGILPEFRERVFEPFFRIGDDGQGFGLGLAIAAQAVAAMNGEIEVVDAPGGGAEFAVRLRGIMGSA